MWRFLKRKHAENSDEVSDEMPKDRETNDENPQATDQFHRISR